MKEHSCGAVLKIASGIHSAFETRGLGSACLEHHQEVLEALGRAPLLPSLPPSFSFTGTQGLELLALEAMENEVDRGRGTKRYMAPLQGSEEIRLKINLKSPLDLSFVIPGLGPRAEALFSSLTNV